MTNERLRIALDRAGLTNEAVARSTGVDPKTVQRWLAGRTFVATEDFSVADILMAHVLLSGVKDEGLIAPYAAVTASRDRCLARPAWKQTIEAYCARVEPA